MKTHWKKLQNPDYLGAYSLAKDSGEFGTMDVTIESLKSTMVTGPNNKSDECIICTFKGVKKPMILNATNCKTLVKLSKSEFIENWIGLTVTLYVAKVKAFGDTVDALRIRSFKQTAPVKPELTPQHPKWGDAVKSLTSKATTLDTILGHFQISDANLEVLKAAIETTNTETNTETTE